MTALLNPAPLSPTRTGPDLGLWVPAVLLAVLVVTCVIGPVIFGTGAGDLADRLLPPGATRADGSVALLGTDAAGRDLATLIVAGLRTSLLVAGVATLVAAIAGTILGVLAGYYGRWIDAAISRLVDIEIVFPAILLAIVIAGLFGPSLVNLIVIMAATRWIVFTRVARASTLSLRERDWVKSSRVLGVGDGGIIVRHVLPYMAGPLATVATLEFAAFVMTEASLSYLGIGLPVTTVSLGKLIAEGRDYLDIAWWISTLPGVLLVLLVVLMGLLGDRLAERHGKTVEDLR